MEDEAEAQEMVADKVWEEVGWLRGRVRELEGRVERGGVRVGVLEGRVGGLEGEVERGRGEIRGWRGRAVVAEGVLGVLGRWGGEEVEEEEGEEEVFMDCE